MSQKNWKNTKNSGISKKKRRNKIRRNRKDRLFIYIFGNPNHKKWLLSIYNAIRGSDYTNPDDIEITTIKNVIYMGMKNDVSFLLTDIMNFFEHQSTFNPNIALRMFIYAGMVYSKYIEKNKNTINLYSSRIQRIPVPKCYCFYNGKKEIEDKVIIKLSDSFDKGIEPDIDVTVTMYNINAGHNQELMEKCKPLYEYSWLEAQIRRYIDDMNYETKDAVDTALEDMPDDYEIKPFLMANKAEVERMCLTQFNEAAYRECERAEIREEFQEKIDSLNNQVNEANARADQAVNIIRSIIEKKMMDDHISEDEAKRRLGIEC